MDRFEALQAFVRVVETSSFTRAAQTLQTSKARVTQLIQQLEGHLRVKLLHRSTRRVAATEAGAAFYERAQRLLAELDDAETSVSAASTAPRGRLRVDVPAPFASLVLLPALVEFQARFPEIQLDLGASDRRVDLIDENVDCVIRGGPLTEPHLRARQLAELSMGVYAAPAYLRRAGIPDSPATLDEGAHVLIGYRGSRVGQPLRPVLQRDGARHALRGRQTLIVDDGNAYLAAGIAGLGVLWLPEYMASAPLQRGQLVPLFAEWRIEPMPLYLAYPQSPHVSRKLRAFIDWVVELIARQPIGFHVPKQRREGTPANIREPE